MILVARQINAYSTEALQLRQRNDILIRDLKSQASRDSLTGLVNRRYFLAEAKQQIEAALYSPQALALMTIDLDHFRQVNDQYGHLAGDAVVVAVVDALSGHLRTAERLRQATAALRLDILGHPVYPTVSIGIALLQEEDPSLSNLMHRADLAMYEAKTQGRNRVVCDIPAMSSEMENSGENTAASAV